MENKTTCACGCGGNVKEGNRFIHGHSRRKIRSCYLCGKRIWRYLSSHQKLTCSVECARTSFKQLNSERQVGTKHFAWKGGYKESLKRQNKKRKFRIETDSFYRNKRKIISHKSYLNYLKNHPGESNRRSAKWYKDNLFHGRARATLNYINVKYRNNPNLFNQALKVFKLNHMLKEDLNGWRSESK